jgi:hypothetical protein
MRRWLVVFLMAVLPLQLSWAAVAAYCQHEQGPAKAAHFGHHDHEHHDDGAAGEDENAKKGPLALDDDCGTCHLGHAQTLLSDAPAMAPPVLPPRVALQPMLHGSHIPALPERPDRRLAA